MIPRKSEVTDLLDNFSGYICQNNICYVKAFHPEREKIGKKTASLLIGKYLLFFSLSNFDC